MTTWHSHADDGKLHDTLQAHGDWTLHWHNHDGAIFWAGYREPEQAEPEVRLEEATEALAMLAETPEGNDTASETERLTAALRAIRDGLDTALAILGDKPSQPTEAQILAKIPDGG